MMRTIQINGIDFPHPTGFAMQRVPNIVSEIVTMSGNVIADYNGWVYQDATLSWPWMDSDTLTSLLAQTDPALGTFTLTFDDMVTGTTNTVNAYRKSVGGTKIATITPDNKVQWRGIEITLSFPDCYH